MKNYLIIDMGTGNSRIVLAREDGKIHGLRHISNVYLRDPAYPDSQYFDIQDWKSKILSSASDLLKEFSDIHVDAITASGCRQSTAFLDDEGNSVYGIPNMDHRGKAFLHELGDGEDIYRITGKWLSTFPAGNLYAIKKKQPELYSRIHKMTSLSEWIGQVLTGRLVLEPSLACETQLFDIDKKEWSEELLNRYGFDRSLVPELADGGTFLANITQEAKAALGIDYDVPFVVGGGDTQNAVLGADSQIGDITVISGTTSPLFFHTKDHFYDKQQRCWVDLNFRGDSYFVETNPGVTGLNFQRMKNTMFADVSYDEMNEKMMAKEIPTMCASFTTLLFDTGEHVTRGGFYTGAPWSEAIDRYDYAAAVGADIACAIYENYLKLNRLIPYEKPYLRGCGGGFQSEFICQTLADLTGKDLLLPKGFSQSSVLGCVKLMNQYFGISEGAESEDLTIYHPSDRSFSRLYYEKWVEYRKIVCGT